MKTKIFFKLNLFWIIYTLFFFAIFILVIYGVVDSLIKDNYLASLLMALCLPVAMYLFLSPAHDPIILKKDCIYMSKDWLGKKSRIQFKVSIRYDEIEHIQIIHTFKNSLGQSIKYGSPAAELTFMEFICKDGEHKRLFVLYHTKRQRIKMINEIKNRMKQVGNNAEIGEATEIVNNIVKAQ